MYDESLSVNNGLISKVRACCEATAGRQSIINEAPPGPTIQPKALMKQTIELYTKTVNDLIAQGYPKQIADATAKQYVLGD